MDAERWAQIKSIYFAAAGRPADERSAFIRSECGGDESLAVEIESLLAAHDQAGSFIEAFPSDETTVALEDLAIEPLIGQQIGPYKVIKMIGRGGMGEVYLAQDGRLGRKVALKTEYVEGESLRQGVGHVPPRIEVIREILDWLNRYLGPVGR